MGDDEPSLLRRSLEDLSIVASRKPEIVNSAVVEVRKTSDVPPEDPVIQILVEEQPYDIET